ncbi:Calcium-dependent lipid-binding family protein [Perilla frutescens var. hirtella]|uniref:Calcium-dependent lipid-binding family protein n=1 Tax=Perilla frutescens var. hirtella TaxID=608512 RepID=A0AAD4IS99_PERFH|nr:Calcium-dependent lipid-binding family protein [Perilla frutescens var. hirtella]
MDALGLLRIRIRRGINLAVRDTRTSDPYVVIDCTSQKVKTRVEKDNCNPVWNEELTISIKDINASITLSVYDHDTFTKDDTMGNAEIDIKPYVECLKMGLQSLPDGSEVAKVEPSSANCLAEESSIVWNKGKLTQDMILRLRDVECGELQLQIEWLDFPGGRGLHN